MVIIELGQILERNLSESKSGTLCLCFEVGVYIQIECNGKLW
jgi:hypothetical protein